MLDNRIYLYYSPCVGSCWLILESPKLTHFTPSLLSHSSLVHFSRDILSYEAVVDTWLDRAPTQHNLSAMRYTLILMRGKNA